MRWSSPDGSLTLNIPVSKALPCADNDASEAAVFALAHDPEVKAQLKRLDPSKVLAYLQSRQQAKPIALVDPYINLIRVLWVACRHIAERSYAGRPH
jgi:hypothetical protein